MSRRALRALLFSASCVVGRLVGGCGSNDETTAPDAAAPVDAASDSSVAHDASADGAAPLSPEDASAPVDAASPPLDAAIDAGVDAAEYLNPVIDRDFPDPFVFTALTDASTTPVYFALATNSGSSNIQAASSTDRIHWSALPDALPTLPSWATAGDTWAPSVLAIGPTAFVLYYTARDTASGRQCVSRATSRTAAGPYVDTSTSAFICQVSGAESLCGSIDPSPFVDADGTAYLVWKSDENACGNPPRLWSAPLDATGTSLTGAHTKLLTEDQSWQSPIIEAPTMLRAGSRYFLLYSASTYDTASYAMGYATCTSPSGPCTNVSVTGPFIATAGSAAGPGGGEFFHDPAGGVWLAYHAWTSPRIGYGTTGAARSLRLDRIAVDGGALSFTGPTTTPQPL